jgi:hypothetical protein
MHLEALVRSDRLVQHLRCQRGAAHAQHERIAEALALDLPLKAVS